MILSRQNSPEIHEILTKRSSFLSSFYLIIFILLPFLVCLLGSRGEGGKLRGGWGDAAKGCNGIGT